MVTGLALTPDTHDERDWVPIYAIVWMHRLVSLYTEDAHAARASLALLSREALPGAGGAAVELWALTPLTFSRCCATCRRHPVLS